MKLTLAAAGLGPGEDIEFASQETVLPFGVKGAYLEADGESVFLISADLGFRDTILTAQLGGAMGVVAYARASGLPVPESCNPFEIAEILQLGLTVPGAAEDMPDGGDITVKFAGALYQVGPANYVADSAA